MNRIRVARYAMINRIKPAPGQESVWDYPRPPRCENFSGHIEIFFAGEIIADSWNSKRVLETSHPPVYYLPPEDVHMEYLHPARDSSWCEWKGAAAYYDIQVKKKRVEWVAWCYPDPAADFRELKNYIAFYAAPMDGCFVDGERVVPQPGNFYGGWREYYRSVQGRER